MVAAYIILSLLASCSIVGESSSPSEREQNPTSVLSETNKVEAPQIQTATPTAYYYYQLGNLYATSGNKKEAINYYKKASQIERCFNWF